MVVKTALSVMGVLFLLHQILYQLPLRVALRKQEVNKFLFLFLLMYGFFPSVGL